MAEKNLPVKTDVYDAILDLQMRLQEEFTVTTSSYRIPSIFWAISSSSTSGSWT
jgi:hypothetical protein